MSRVLTYRVRLREKVTSWVDDDAFLHGTRDSYPLVIMQQCGTERRGAPWARRDIPVWVTIGVARDTDDALALIRKDAEREAMNYLAQSKSDRLREQFREVIITASISDDGTVTVNG